MGARRVPAWASEMANVDLLDQQYQLCPSDSLSSAGQIVKLVSRTDSVAGEKARCPAIGQMPQTPERDRRRGEEPIRGL
jgi:hypothetical protein